MLAQITGTEFAYYHLCQRKLWLFSHGIHMEHTSDRVAEGKLLHENSYSRKKKEIEIFGCVIDHFDTVNKVVHEVKLTPAMSEVHIKQLQYYLYLFKHLGNILASGMLDYPKLKKRQAVELDLESETYIKSILDEIVSLKQRAMPPLAPSEPIKICKSCSYAEYCFA